MHLDLTAKQRALVTSVEDFVAEWRAEPDHQGGYLKALCARGWSAPGWHKPWGGGLAMAEAFLVERALAQAGMPILDARTLQQTGPLLMALADEPLCRRFLPAMASGEARWALHGSVLGAAPVRGWFLSAELQLEPARTLVYGASDATAIAMILAQGSERALVLAELTDGSLMKNLPLDPETIYLDALKFELLATTRTHPALRAALAGAGGTTTGLNCWTGRLRRQYQHLLRAEAEREPQAGAQSELTALGIELGGLEVMEQRAVFSADSNLRAAVGIRSARLGRALAELAVDRLGYYALAAPEPALQHNELPEPALAARDAMADLIRYLDDDFGMQRGRLALSLGLVGK